MQVVVWILIILVVIFLIWLLKRWIKRIIFILILLALAFFIYGIFNPSGAARLWYNVRTFPSRMASRMGSGKEFLDYNTYKSKISSIGDEIGDKIGDKIGLDEDTLDVDLSIGEKDEVDEGKNVDFDVEKNENNDEEKNSDSDEKQVIKAFPKSINFVGVPKLKERNEKGDKSENVGPLTGYSKTDLLGVINKYIEKNLDENTDILVTVEYENDSADPQKIILQTQSKSGYLISNSGNLVDDLFEDSHGSNSENMVVSSDETIDVEEVKPVQKQAQTTKKTTSTKLTQKEQKEAEEIFSILF